MRILFTLVGSLMFLSVAAQSTVITHVINSSEDDAEQEGAFVDLNDLELDLGWDHGSQSLIGLHFRSVKLRPNAVLDSAYLQLTAQADLTDTLKAWILLEANPFPLNYNDSVGIAFDRSMVADSVLWAIAPCASGDLVTSPNLNYLIGLLIDQANWSPSGGLNFLIKPTQPALDSTRSEFECYAFEQSVPARRPQLVFHTDSSQVTGIAQDATSGLQALIYPNPTAGLLHIKDGASVLSWEVFSVSGERLLGGSDHLIDASNLPAGCYVIQVQRTSGTVRARFLRVD
jgi:hypothetical protein